MTLINTPFNGIYLLLTVIGPFFYQIYDNLVSFNIISAFVPFKMDHFSIESSKNLLESHFKMALKILEYHKCRVRLYWIESLPLVVFKLVYGWLEGGGANFLGAFWWFLSIFSAVKSFSRPPTQTWWPYTYCGYTPSHSQ